MKKMAGILALVLLLCFVMSGCNKTDDLTGMWYAELDITDYVNENMVADELREYVQITRFVFQYIVQFYADESYSFGVSYYDAEEMYHWSREEYRAGLERYYKAQIAEQNLDMTVREYLAEKGTSLYTLVEKAFPEMQIYDFIEQFYFEGKYIIKDGKLLLSSGFDIHQSKSFYVEYTLEDSVLTFTGGTIEIPEEYNIFPIPLMNIS